MYDLEITELGQIREQENMQESAQSQALSRARRGADRDRGTPVHSRAGRRRRLAAMLREKGTPRTAPPSRPMGPCYPGWSHNR